MKIVASRLTWVVCCVAALSACGDDPGRMDRDAVRSVAVMEALASNAQTSNLVVYDDAPQNGFKDGGWGTYNLKSTAYVHSGRYAAMLTPTNWDGLQFAHAAQGANAYTALTFYINGGTGSGQTIWAGVTDTKNNHYYTAIDSYLSARRIQANNWQQVTLPLADIHAAGAQIASVYIMTGVANNQANVYVDDVALVTASGGTTTGGSGTTTGGTNTTAGSTTAGGTSTTTGGASTGGTTTSSGTTTGGSTTGGSSTTTTGGAPAGSGTTTGGTTAGGTTAGSTTSAGTTTGSSSSSAAAESWVWVYANWQTSLSTILSNPTAFTHISPTFYSINYNYTSGVAYYANCTTSSGTYNCTNAGTNNFGGLTTAAYTKQLASAGLATVPAIYAGSANGGSDAGVENILNNTNGAGTNFINAMVQEAVSNGYAGYNLDWEMGAAVGSTYADKFISFVNSFKAALQPHGMSLSVDAIVSNINGTWCSGNNGYLDFAKLATSSIDRVIIENYTATLGTAYSSCQPVVLSASTPVACPVNSSGSDVTATGLFNFMCHNLPASMVVVGLESYSTGSNGIAGQAVSIMQQYGINKIAIWPQIEGSYPFLSAQGLVANQSDWYSLLSSFLSYFKK